MAKLVFNADQVAAVVREALAAKKWMSCYGKPGTAPGLWLVHDQGVYLMSNALDRDPKTAPLAYAAGCDPKDEDWWETSRALVGGDDFAEPIEIDAQLRTAVERGLRGAFSITLTEEQLTVDLEAVLPAKAAH
jgi:hypothetical protein